MLEKFDQEKLTDRGLSLSDLIDIQKWQKIQDSFAIVTGVTVRTLNTEGKLLTIPSKETRFCSQVISSSPAEKKTCGLCLPTFLGGEGRVDKNLGFGCRIGLRNFLVPMEINKKTLGYIVIGPVVLVARKSKEEYQQAAEKLNINFDTLWNAILEIKVISFHGINSLIELIQNVSHYTLNLAYNKINAAKESIIIPEDSLKLKNLLESLLDVTFEASGADLGSIMFLDKKNNELTIKASRGIPEEIASKTRVKLGEGISGIAANNKEMFLINRELSADNINHIERYLTRTYIGSSMVIPLMVENEVLGVMNLGALEKSATIFDNDKLNLVNRIIGLATNVIVP